MTGLLSLATELLRDICDEFETGSDDICNIRAVCKRLNVVVAPRFFSYLTVEIHKDNLDAAKHLLAVLSAGESLYSSFAETLKIRSLSPASDPHAGPNSQKGGKRECDNLYFRPVSRHMKLHLTNVATVKYMKLHLAPAICSLKNVGTVKWAVGYNEPGWAMDTVLASISSLPRLNSISVTFSMPVIFSGSATSHPAISQMKNLRKLDICGNSKSVGFRRYISHHMHRIIANSPGLTHVEVSNGSLVPRWDKSPSLHDLFGQLSETGAPLLKLQHLSLNSWKMRLDAVTMPHLRSLTSLELYKHLGVNESNPHSSYIEQIWTGLLAEGVHLTELCTEHMNNELLYYLASYSGLKTLRLPFLDMPDLADTFFRTVLPRHKDTLETLHMRARFEGPWCFRPGSVDFILGCQKLVVLVSTVEYNLWDEEEKDIDALTFVLEKVTHLPHLIDLTLLPADRPSNRGNKCGNLEERYTGDVGATMRREIQHFQPDPAVHPEAVKLDTQVYKIGLLDEGGEKYFRYLSTGDLTSRFYV